MGTRTDNSVDWIVRTNFFEDALYKSTRNWSQLLPDIGVDTIVYHRDWFSSGELDRLDTVLPQWFGPPTIESDSGHILIWMLTSTVANRREAQEALRTYFPEIE